MKMSALITTLLVTSAVAFVGISATEATTASKQQRAVKPSVSLMEDKKDAEKKPADDDGASERTPEKLYTEFCSHCHDPGIAGAPPTGDKKWLELAKARGFDTLVKNTIKGVGIMPPRGTCVECSDDELKAAVQYMLDKSKANAGQGEKKKDK